MSLLEKNDIRLLSLLGLALLNRKWDNNQNGNISETDWNQIRSIAERQGVSAIVFESLEELEANGLNLSLSMDSFMDWLGQVSHIGSVYEQHL